MVKVTTGRRVDFVEAKLDSPAIQTGLQVSKTRQSFAAIAARRWMVGKRMKTPNMAKENNFVLREAAKVACDGYYTHLVAGGKSDPAEERWIEALTAGADAITQVAVLESRLAQVESTYSQVSKALCGKENATICEVLDAVSQVKSRLAQVERERDALLRDLQSALETPCVSECDYCARQYEPGDMCDGCRFIWRGVCHENTKEETK